MLSFLNQTMHVLNKNYSKVFLFILFPKIFQDFIVELFSIKILYTKMTLIIMVSCTIMILDFNKVNEINL